MRPQLRFIVTERCNLNCEYCHKDGLPPADPLFPGRRDAVSLPARFAALSLAQGYAEADLSLYGGEPLLDPGYIDDVLRAASEAGSRGFRYETILNTNATRITAEVARSLADRDVEVHASLDGVDALANGLRVDFAGHSSAERAKDGIRLLREAGCRLQINTVLTAQNLHGLEELIQFAADAGAVRVFLALADDRTSHHDAEALARRLLMLESCARGRIRLAGPWRSGLGPAKPLVAWPPLNVNVLPTGEVFFPHFPDEPQASLDRIFSAESTAHFGPRWVKVLESCGECPIMTSCGGYLRLMVRYHRGSAGQQEAECTLARTVERMARDREFELLRPSLDLHLRPAGRELIEIRNPLLAGSRLVVSDDVAHILSALARGGSLAALRRSFEADNLDAAIAMLRARRLLAPPAEDTDQLLLSELSAAETLLPGPGLRLGAESPELLAAWDPIVPYLEAACSRLRGPLESRETPLCLLGVHDRTAMARVLGLDPRAPELEWMAATVFHSILVFNLEACGRLVRGGGRRRLDVFVRQCTHEFIHLALRHAGVRLPVWLEEGFCEFLSGAPLTPEALRYAAVFQPAFREFVSDPESASRNLLAFSVAPVDENPAYHLAHDFAAFLVRRTGLDRLLDLLQKAGVRPLVRVFPLESGSGLLAQPLEDVLETWAGDLASRLAEGVSCDSPLRVFVHEGSAVLYNRLLGGMCNGGPPPCPEWLDRNLTLEEGIRLWGEQLRHHPRYANWQAGVTPRRRTLHLRLIVENACNLRCGYCYQEDFKSRSMTVETADRAIAVWRDLLLPGDLERATIRLFGGEPLLNWETTAHVLREMEGWDAGDAIVNTNGTLLGGEHVERLQRLPGRIGVALSCDGIGEVHDAARSDGAGRGSFARVDAAARLLARARVPFTMNAVVGAHNHQGLLALAQYVDSLRVAYGAAVGLGLELLIPSRASGEPAGSAGGGTANRAGILEACEQTVAWCLEHEVPLAGTMLYPFDALCDRDGASGYFCAAAGSEMIVDPSGGLVHCPAIPIPAHSDLETVARAGAIADPLHWRERRAGGMPGCRGCEIEGLCGGGCAAYSHVVSGDIFATPSPLFCEVMRSVFRGCLEHAVSTGCTSA